MNFSVKILADSIAPNECRLTTFELTYPRFVHSELMTHRLFSRNSASSRALPTQKLLQQIISDPVIPIHIGANQKGMQAEEEITTAEQLRFLHDLDALRIRCVDFVKRYDGVVHKQIINRYIESFMWITVILSATEFGNWFNLRYHKDAEPHIFHLAEMMWQQYSVNNPDFVDIGNWHLPLTGFPGDESLSLEEKKMISVGRCARVSYLTHNGIRDIQADIDLCQRLTSSGHWSPFEHVATPVEIASFIPESQGNFRGWKQFRKDFPNENRKDFNGPNPR